MLTCTGDLSRNRQVGLALARGESTEEIVANLGHVAEGVGTARTARALAERLGVDMPITREVAAVLFDGKPARAALTICSPATFGRNGPEGAGWLGVSAHPEIVFRLFVTPGGLAVRLPKGGQE